MGKKNKGREGLPKQLFVTRVGGPSESTYFEAQSSAKKIVEARGSKETQGGIPVGVYVLKELGEITTETSYKRKRFTKV